jgi:uncharacterized protein YndB with AHSA1/START domain
MSEITHDMSIKASSSTVYKALTTAQGLRSWFTAQAEGSGQPGTEWKLKFTDQPSFNWQIVSVEDQCNVSWKCLQGPGNSAGTEAEFSLKPESDNQCTFTISHRGWTKDDPKYERCVKIWHVLLDHLRRYCETGIPSPAYQ